MKIAILAHNLRVAGGRSVGLNVIAGLSRLPNEHEYLIIMPTGVGYEEIPKPARSTCVHFVRKGQLQQAWYEMFTLPKLVRDFGAERAWGLGNFGLHSAKVPQGILFHQSHLVYDPSDLPRPVWKVSNSTKYIRWRIKQALKTRPLMFCQTETAKSRFRKMMNYEGPFAIMPNAVSRFAMHETPPPAPAIFSELTGKRVLFCLTRYYAHKNLESLVDLFAAESNRLSDVVVMLTIEASNGPGAERLIERIQQPDVRDHFCNVGRVQQTELEAYYRASSALILPTVLESFTGTYLEAMQFGTPILTSDMDFAHDICGEAAAYFDPFNPQNMREVILSVLDSPEQADDLVSKGRNRVQSLFRDWDDIVSEALGKLLEHTGRG